MALVKKMDRIKNIRRLTAMLLVFAALIAFCSPALAADKNSEPRVLRVAFPQVKGMTETAEDGTRRGLVVDYLKEIAKYTGWQYEYVDIDGEAMLEGFGEGQFELMGGTYYAEGFEAYYAYPDYNTGYSKSVLLARWKDSSIRSNDLESMDGKTIGVYQNAKENIRRLKEFLSANHLNCTIKYYGQDQLSEDGDLYYCLENGEVDLLLGNGFADVEEFRIITSFNSQPFYIVTNVGNQEVLDGLNMALGKITDANPNFSAERYAANYPDGLSVDIQLTDEELKYIDQRKSVKVAVVNDWHPLFCVNSADDGHCGLVPDILKEVSSYSGLEFTYVYGDTYMDAVRLVQNGEADILGFFLGDETDAEEFGLALTAPFESINSIVVRNKASSYPGEDLVGASLEGRKLPSDISASQVLYYPDVREALAAVNKGEADFMYGLSARMERDIQRYQFNNLVPVTIVNDSDELNFALSYPVDSDLLTILNKALNRLSSEKKTEILNRNMVSVGAGQLSLPELIYGNPVLFIGVLSLILIILVVSVLWVNHARTKAAIMQNELEKAEAESRAKGDFLSRMSHEIRTPMNAVMGMADLISMKKNVPEDLREDLSKIRSSSHYLLDLINDILDMSRIDSGMLSIAQEPFSMEQMLDEIQSMMEGETRRKKLTYRQEAVLTHKVLAGDVIRLRQVLTNLLSNAFKFTPEGGNVRLQVTEEAGSDTDAAFSFRVSDTGKGISPEDQKRIFESFEQLGTNYSKSQGTGLGLAISSNIVRLMGGELKVESELGKGSEFYFTVTLPFSTLENAQREEAIPPAGEGQLEGIRILLVEDNDLNAEIAAELLEIQGALVSRCENGAQALERFQESSPNEYQVILMDIQMPEMNGLEAARRIRALERPDASNVPIIAMTANSFQEDVDAAIAAGMDKFVSKPLDVHRFYRLLQEILKEK